MDWRWVLMIVVVVAIVPAGSPIDISYVSSDSMEPTLQTGDGYVLVPAGQVQEGDIVTYRSPADGELVTHRVVDVDTAGLTTKGDANQVTDQAAGAPPVPTSAVVGEVLTVADTVVRIPGLGTATTWLNQHLLVALGIGAATLLLGKLRQPRAADRRPTRVGELVVPLVVILGVFAIVMVFVATSTHTLTFVAIDGATDHPRQLTVGESGTKPVTLEGTAPPLSHRVVSTDGMKLTDIEQQPGRIELSVTVPPPQRPGDVTKRVRVYHYPATLPQPILRQLHAVHPLVAATSSVAVSFAPLLGAALLCLDCRRLIRGPRSRRMRGVFER